jgi:ABC-type nitrate/sulfonate/bicarbonate transport system substrate-binding protein
MILSYSLSARAVCFLAVALWAGVFAPGAAAHGQTRRFLFGYSSLSANQTALWVARDEGFFKRFALDPDVILIEGGTRGAQALISGDLPVMALSGQPVISARARGADLVLVGGMINKMNYILASAPGIKKPEDLKGKRIGIAQIGTASYHAIVLAFKHWGLDLRRDRVTLLQVGNQGARVASLQTGGSDAVIVNPGLAGALQARGFNVLADFTELPIPYPQQALGVRERTLKSDPEFIEQIVKSVAAGMAFVWEQRNKERVKKVLARYLRLGSVESAEEHYQAALKVMPRKPYVDVAGISSMIDFMAESDPLVAKVKPEEVINESALKKLEDSGFLNQLYKR